MENIQEESQLINQEPLKRYGIIYKATCKTNGKSYIGQTIQNFEKYKKEHIREAMRNADNNKKAFYGAIRKYGKEDFDWEIIKECYNRDELNQSERFYIKEFKSLVTENGYNMLDGVQHTKSSDYYTEEHRLQMNKEKAERSRGKSCSLETREKISKTLMGRIIPKKSRINMSKALMGRPCKEETRARLRTNNLGQQRTDETKKKMSEAQKGISANSKYINKDGIIKRIFQHEVEKYLSEGWLLGNGRINSEEDKIKRGETKYINKDNINTRVRIDVLESYLNDGWQLGKIIRKSTKGLHRTDETKKKMSDSQMGTKHIYRGDEFRSIKIHEVEKYLNEGWILGNRKNKKEGNT